MADFDILIRMASDVSGLMSGLAQAGSAVDSFSGKMAMKDVGKAVANTGKVMTAGLTVPLLGIAAGAAKIGIGFKDQMAIVGAVTNAGEDSLRQLEATAREMGRTTRYSAREAGQGMEALARAGFDADQITSALPHTLNLATAGAIDLGEAAGITANVLNGFGMEVNQTQRVADVLAKTAADTDTTVAGLGETFKYVGPVASSLGFELEEMAAAAGIMGDAGIKAGQAGNMLKRGLLNLASPTKQQTDLMNELGMEFFDSQGKMKSMVDIVAELENGLEGMTDQQKNATLATLFGSEAVSGWTALLNKGSGELQKLQTNLEDSTGFAQKFADKVEKTVGGSLRTMISALEEAGIGLYEAFEEPLHNLIKKITELANKFNALPDSTKRSIATFGFIVAAIGPVLLVLGTLISIVARVAGAFSLLSGPAKAAGTATKAAGTASKLAGVGFAGLGAKLALVAGVVAIVVAALLLLSINAEGVKVVIQALAEAVATVVVALGQGLAEMIRALGDAFAEIARGIGDAISKIIVAITPIVEIFSTTFTQIVSIVASAVVQMTQAIAPFIPAVTHMVEVVVTTLPSIIDAFSNLASSVGSAISQVVTAVANGASQIIGSLSELVAQIGDSVSQILNAFGRLASKVASAISEVVTAVSDGASQIIGAITNLVSKLTSGIAEIITAFGDMATRVGDAIATVNESIASLVDSMAGFVEQIGKTAHDLAEAFGKLVDELERLSTIDLSGQGADLGKLAAGFVALGLSKPEKSAEGLGEFSEAVATVTGVQELSDQITSLGEAFTELPELATIATGFTSIGESIASITGVTELTADFTSLGTELTSLGETLTSIGESFATFAETVSKAMSELSSTVSEAFTTLGTNIQAQMTAIQSNISSSMSLIESTVSSALSSMQSEVTSTLNSIKSAVDSAMNSIQQQVQSTTDNMKQTFTSAMENIKSTVTSGFQAVVQAVTSSMQQAVSAVQNAMNSAVVAMNSAAGQALAAGANMGRGFYNGLSSMAGSIISLAQSIASRAASAMRSALRIHSPSRVTGKIGKYTGQGLVVGLDGMKRVVARTAEKLADIAGSIHPKDIQLPDVQMGSVHGGNFNAGGTSMDDIVAGRNQNMEVHLTMGGHTFRTFVGDITDVQQAELRLESY